MVHARTNWRLFVVIRSSQMDPNWSSRSNPSVNSLKIQNLNALIGVAYGERRRFPIPHLGYLATESQMENEERISAEHYGSDASVAGRSDVGLRRL